MEWQCPQFLYLILPLCVGWSLLALYSEQRRQKARAAFVSPVMWQQVLPDTSRGRFWTKLALQEIAIICGLMALARPMFGTQYEQVVPRGSDLYVLIDVSRSMLADDVPPSRLERAKSDVSALVNRLEGERIGLVAFAGQAVVKCPLTVDYDSFRRTLNELDPNSAPRGGTAIGDAIRKALEVFQAKADRDQAILLITDGDDQSSYPQEAATVAAERNVTIFTVGLGDSEQGSRIPQNANASAFVEHEGQQVWSKLDSKLLEEIAVKTSGVYIPAGTRAYDLGELYVSHLQGRKGDESAAQQRIRRSEQFQIFLSIALLMLLVDIGFNRYQPAGVAKIGASMASSLPLGTEKASNQSVRRGDKKAVVSGLMLAVTLSGFANADDSKDRIREGLKLYHQDQFEEAAREFAQAGEELDKEKSGRAAIAAFDEACASHRKGDFDKAKDLYLKAGLSADRTIATSSHFNLGTLSADKARKLAGEKPEEVSPDKRQEILDELKQAVASYRHCLELHPNHLQSRRNLELVRIWIKYYSDRWRERDRQKVRDESNLLQFLEFLTKTQTVLQSTVKQLPQNTSADTFAELKRAQDELGEEIPTLQEKIEAELRPSDSPASGSAAPQSGASQSTPPSASSQTNSGEIEEGIKLLQSWATKAGDKMSNAGRQLGLEEPADAMKEQTAALEELDRIWEAIVPFHPLLAKELADQTTIASQLKADDAPTSEEPDRTTAGGEQLAAGGTLDQKPSEAPVENNAEPTGKQENAGVEKPSPATDASASSADTPTVSGATGGQSSENRISENKPTNNMSQSVGGVIDEPIDFGAMEESQSLALKRARLLAPKAEAELAHAESQPPVESAASMQPTVPADPSTLQSDPAQQQEQQQTVDPEAVKAGYRKAIELAPRVVEQMESAIQRLQKKDRQAAAVHAEEARRILEEIQKAQPKNEQKDQQNQDGDQQKEQKDEGQKDGDKEPKPDEDKSGQQDDKEKKQNNDDKKKSDDEKSRADDKTPQKQQKQHQVSKDRIDEALRKVRERQQEKQDRDRKTRARIKGQVPVDKDW